MHTRLVAAGVHVTYLPWACVFDEKPVTWDAIVKQRKRWIRGHLEVAARLTARGEDLGLVDRFYLYSPVIIGMMLGLFAMGWLSFLFPQLIPGYAYFSPWFWFASIVIMVAALSSHGGKGWRLEARTDGPAVPDVLHVPLGRRAVRIVHAGARGLPRRPRTGSRPSAVYSRGLEWTAPRRFDWALSCSPSRLCGRPRCGKASRVPRQPAERSDSHGEPVDRRLGGRQRDGRGHRGGLGLSRERQAAAWLEDRDRGLGRTDVQHQDRQPWLLHLLGDTTGSSDDHRQQGFVADWHGHFRHAGRGRRHSQCRHGERWGRHCHRPDSRTRA